MATDSKNTIKDTLFSYGSNVIEFEQYTDERGTLLPIELEGLPFAPKRLFTVAGMSAGTVRGGHGHYTCQQLLICLHGCIEILLRSKDKEDSITLLPGSPALLVDSGIWCRQTYITENSVLLVLASEPYHIDSYFEDWE